MRENQLPVHHTSAEETGQVRPTIDSGEQVTKVKSRSAGDHLANDLSNSVHITLAHCSAAGSASAAPAVALPPRAVPDPPKQYEDDEVNLEETLDPALGTWLLVFAVVSVTTLYTICYPKLVPSFVAQTLKISKQLSAYIERRPGSPLAGTAADTAKAGAGTAGSVAGIHGAPTGAETIDGGTSNSLVRGVRLARTASPMDVDRSAAERDDTGNDAHRPPAPDRDETGTRENSHRHISQEHTLPATEMPKPAAAKASKSKIDFLVPPPPATPCVLPPASGIYSMQPAQQQAWFQQQLQQAQAQAGSKTHNQAATSEKTPQQPTAASGRNEATQPAALDEADQELQAALSSSLRTVSEWKR